MHWSRKAKSAKDVPCGVAAKIGVKGAGHLSGVVDQHHVMLEGLVPGIGQVDVSASAGHGRLEGDGCGNDAGVDVAGSRELSGLRDVFTQQEFPLYPLPQPVVLEHLPRRPAVRCMFRVGYGQPLQTAVREGTGQIFESRVRSQPGPCGYEQHQAPYSINLAGAFGEASAGQRASAAAISAASGRSWDRFPMKWEWRP